MQRPALFTDTAKYGGFDTVEAVICSIGRVSRLSCLQFSILAPILELIRGAPAGGVAIPRLPHCNDHPTVSAGPVLANMQDPERMTGETHVELSTLRSQFRYRYRQPLARERADGAGR